jgi:hypothetical protein
VTGVHHSRSRFSPVNFTDFRRVLSPVNTSKAADADPHLRLTHGFQQATFASAIVAAEA